jgi:hypothetical protein
MDPIEAKKLALREAVALHAAHSGASDDDVLATATTIYHWLRNGSDVAEFAVRDSYVPKSGEPIWAHRGAGVWEKEQGYEWPVTREESARKCAVFADGLGVSDDWPLVT